MSWVTDWSGSRNIEQRCRELEHQLNSRPDTGRLWERMHAIGRVANNNAPKVGSLLVGERRVNSDPSVSLGNRVKDR